MTSVDFNDDDFVFEGEFDTKREAAADGEYGPAEIVKFESFHGVSEATGRPWMRWQYTFRVDDPELEKRLGRKITARRSLFVDLTEGSDPERPTLDFGKGKNVDIGQMRQLFKQNNGKPWSPKHLIGQTVSKVHLKMVPRGTRGGDQATDMLGQPIFDNEVTRIVR